ncbi:MAG: trypsin-like serine protease [Ruminococcaceae bacterium]|nr:trypsin-like serine protease [Oscillospiraceae bacterium]
MKKIVSISLAIVLLFSLCLPVAATQSTETVDITYRNIKIVINGTEITPCDGAGNPVEPFIMNRSGRIYLPVRAVANALGLTVGWDNATNTISLTSNGSANYGTGTPISSNMQKTEQITYRDIQILLDGAPLVTDSEAFIMNSSGTTYLPLRTVAEALGTDVGWDNATNTAMLTASSPQELNAEEIYAKCSPAVFYIEVYNAAGKATASGSGFFIDSQGTAVTNYHVIEGASSAKIRTADTQTQYDVVGVYAYDKENDWAVLKIDGSGFSYLKQGADSTIVGGATVYALGSPEGLDNSISQGLISNPNRTVNGVEYIQTSAAISHGSSGGALINKYGAVIGITTATITDGQNLNFALPISIINGYTCDSITPLANLLPKPEIPTGAQAEAFAILKKWIARHYTHVYTDSNDKVYIETIETESALIESRFSYNTQDNNIEIDVIYMPYDSNYCIYYSRLYLSETDVTHDTYFRIKNRFFDTTLIQGRRSIHAPTFTEADPTDFHSYTGKSESRTSALELSNRMLRLSLTDLEAILHDCSVAYGGSYSIADFGFTSLD